MDSGQNGMFEAGAPATVKSIKQRDLLNNWLRLYARDGRLPQLDDYRPERIEDEVADIVYYTVETAEALPRIVIDSDGTRLSNVYGKTGRGQNLDDYLGPKLRPIVMPVYYECIRRRLPIYTISKVSDIDGRMVDYERLLLPFGDGESDCVRRIFASLKAISEDGGFEIRNLMRNNDVLPVTVLRSVIERDLVQTRPARGSADDIIEFN